MHGKSLGKIIAIVMAMSKEKGKRIKEKG